MLPFTKKKLRDNHPVDDDQLHPAGKARTKVEQDIAFLRERIAALKAHARPNMLLIDHYESMLRNRESVLKWLLDGCDDETSHSESTNPKATDHL